VLLALVAGSGFVALQFALGGGPAPQAGSAPAVEATQSFEHGAEPTARAAVEPAADGTPDAARRPQRVARADADDDDDDGSEPRDADRARAGTERRYRTDFEALAHRDPAGFRARANAVLAGDGPANEKVALLRAAYTSGCADATSLFARAVATLPPEAGVAGESVPATALAWLRRRAVTEPAARAVLEEVVWSGTWRAAPAWRAGALRTLIAASGETELPRLRGRVLAEHDRDVFEAGIAALDERTRPPEAAPAPVEDPD